MTQLLDDPLRQRDARVEWLVRARVSVRPGLPGLCCLAEGGHRGAAWSKGTQWPPSTVGGQLHSDNRTYNPADHRPRDPIGRAPRSSATGAHVPASPQRIGAIVVAALVSDR